MDPLFIAYRIYLCSGVLVAIGIDQRDDDEAQLAEHLYVPGVSLRQLVDAIEGRGDGDPFARMCSRLYEDGFPAVLTLVDHRNSGLSIGSDIEGPRRLLPD